MFTARIYRHSLWHIKIILNLCKSENKRIFSDPPTQHRLRKLNSIMNGEKNYSSEFMPRAITFCSFFSSPMLIPTEPHTFILIFPLTHKAQWGLKCCWWWFSINFFPFRFSPPIRTISHAHCNLKGT